MMVASANIISQYPTQVYYSVLPFLPSDTYLSRQYPGRISILIGRENSWSPLLFNLPEQFRLPATCFSPDGGTLAVEIYEGLSLYDTSSGLLNSSIEALGDHQYGRESLQAMFTADGSKVFVLFRTAWGQTKGRSHGIQTCDLAKQNVRLDLFPETVGVRGDPIRLSGDGSYVVYPGYDKLNTQICTWQIKGGNYTSIPIGCNGRVRDLALTGDSSHLVVVAVDDIIIILDVPSGHIQQRLPHRDVQNVCLSPDGLFIASTSLWSPKTRLFSTTQGTLLAVFELGMTSLGFSRTNHLYMLPVSGHVRVYNALGNHEARLIPVPGRVRHILPSLDDSQIVIQMATDSEPPHYGIEVWSLRRFTDTHDNSAPHPNTILNIDLSSDASLLAIATQTEIEIWDARIGRRRDVILTQSANYNTRPVSFSPRGELIVSSSQDGIIIVDAQAGVLIRTIYPFV